MNNYTHAIITFYNDDEADMDNQVKVMRPIVDTSEIKEHYEIKLTGQPTDDGAAIIVGALDLNQ